MNKLLVFGLLGLLLFSCVIVIDNEKTEETNNMEEQIYQGPVPQGYNLEHFRKTGETIKEVFD